MCRSQLLPLPPIQASCSTGESNRPFHHGANGCLDSSLSVCVVFVVLLSFLLWRPRSFRQRPTARRIFQHNVHRTDAPKWFPQRSEDGARRGPPVTHGVAWYSERYRSARKTRHGTAKRRTAASGVVSERHWRVCGVGCDRDRRTTTVSLVVVALFIEKALTDTHSLANKSKDRQRHR